MHASDLLQHARDAPTRRDWAAARPADAARIGIDVAVMLFLRGDDVIGAGWISRAQRLLADEAEDPAHGYLRHAGFVDVKTPTRPAARSAWSTSARRC
ncbi:MAG TPA: hypothetical protein VFZ70_02310 [Euzebyales bacterium]